VEERSSFTELLGKILLSTTCGAVPTLKAVLTAGLERLGRALATDLAVLFVRAEHKRKIKVVFVEHIALSADQAPRLLIRLRVPRLDGRVRVDQAWLELPRAVRTARHGDGADEPSAPRGTREAPRPSALRGVEGMTGVPA
jgi:hypothetical protein